MRPPHGVTPAWSDLRTERPQHGETPARRDPRTERNPKWVHFATNWFGFHWGFCKINGCVVVTNEFQTPFPIGSFFAMITRTTAPPPPPTLRVVVFWVVSNPDHTNIPTGRHPDPLQQPRDSGCHLLNLCFYIEAYSKGGEVCPL